MANIKELEVRILLQGGTSETNGTIQIESWNQKERKMRALKALAACWGAAIVCVILPILHFFLVPGFLIAGPVMALILNSKSSVVLGGKGICPHCENALPIARTAFKFPFPDLCTRCQSSVEVLLKEVS